MAQKKLHSFAFSSPLDSKTLTKSVTKPDGSVVTLNAFPVLPASPFRTMDSRSNIEFSYVAQQLIDDYNEQGRRHPLDIEHNTERGGDTRARGWSVEMTTAEHEPDVGFEPGVLYCWYELTPLGLQEHNDQLYGYTSAVADGFWLDENHVQFNHIKSNARTNNPATKVPFSLTAITEAHAPADPGYTPENVSSDGDDPVMLKAILEALGLTAETDEAAALAAVGTLKEQAAQAVLAARIDASDVSENFTGSFVAATRVEAVQTQLTDLTTQLTAARDEVTALTAKLTAAEQAQTKVRLTAAIDALARDKKVTPAQREAALELAGSNFAAFERFAADLQPVTDGVQTPGPGGNVHLNLTAEDVAKAKTAGIAPETFAREREEARKQLG
jgi:phage I-like protein